MIAGGGLRRKGWMRRGNGRIDSCLKSFRSEEPDLVDVAEDAVERST